MSDAANRYRDLALRLRREAKDLPPDRAGVLIAAAVLCEQRRVIVAKRRKRAKAVQADPAQLRLDAPVYADPVWRGLSKLMAGAPPPDGRGGDSLPEDYRTSKRP